MKIGINQLEISQRSVVDVVSLKLQKTFIITPVLPYNFRYSLWKPSHFYTGLEAHTVSHSWRTLRYSDDIYVAFEAYEENANINLNIYTNKQLFKDDLDYIYNHIVYSYGVFETIDIPKKIINKFNKLKGMNKTILGTRISCPENMFEISIISLLLQNTTIQRTTSMFRNLVEQYGKLICINDLVLFMFFSPNDILKIEEATLKEKCRLGYRAKYMKNFAEFFSKRKDTELRKLSKQELLEKLQTIKGVGPYTSNIVVSHALRDKSAISLDSWNRKILSNRIYSRDLLESDELQDMLYNNFGDYAGIISMYVIENEYMNKPVVPLYNFNI
jgi:3-methyladenine DNA glycosylase/8-oxoguanine DNA glycosylase